MRDILLYDIDRFRVFIHGREERTGRIPVIDGDIVTAYDVDNAYVLTDKYMQDNIANSRIFQQLAGEIYLIPKDRHVFSTLPRCIRTEHYDENYLHIEYNGVTRLTIEDREYIYEIVEPSYVDFSIRYEDHLFIITYRTCEKSHMIVLLKDGDYVELLNVSGDSIDIDERSVSIVTYLHDSLGRVRHEIYEPKERTYELVKCYFDYTYRVQYDNRLNTILLEDAIAGRDYEYIIEHMSEDASIEDVRDYFSGILGRECTTLSVEAVTNTMHFLVDTPSGRVIKDIKVYYDEVGRVANFDGGDNAE